MLPLSSQPLVVPGRRLGTRTALRNLDYESPITRMRADVAARPDNVRLHYNLANSLLGLLLIIPESRSPHLGFDLCNLGDFSIVVKDCLAG